MIARFQTRRFPRGLRRVFVFGMAAFALGRSADSSTKEERDSASEVFLAAEENIVAQCVYRLKPEEVVWGALAGLARDLGPDYARFFPSKGSGSFDEARDTYWLTLLALGDERKIPLKTLVARSIRAYCRSIDHYSDYDDFETYAKEKESERFNYVGIGVSLVLRKTEGFILNPFPDGPAERAGIVGGDYLLEVNGVSVRGMSINEVVVRCAGKEGTRVTLKIRHADNTEEPMPVVREKMTASPLKLSKIASGWLVTCSNFISNQSVEDFRTMLRSLRNGEVLTIDFRGCPGGTVKAGVDMASLFLPADAIIGKLETANGQEKLISANKTPYRPSKLTILQDRFTASAAELVIVALTSDRRLHVETRGERTFGKGVTVMQVDCADASGRTAGILSITYSRMYGPNNEGWDGEGLPPTVEKK